ncbi:MAG: hypothetical protein ACLUTA_06765 [Blautia wexlerae]
MKFRWDNRYLHWGVTAFLVIAASMLFYYGIFHMKTLIVGIKTFLGIMAPIIYGVILAYILSPLINLFEQKLIYPQLEKHEVQSAEKGKRAIRWGCVTSFHVFILGDHLRITDDGASSVDPKYHEYYLQFSVLYKSY